MVQKLPTDIFSSDFGHFIFKKYQKEHNFEMFLIKRKIKWSKYPHIKAALGKLQKIIFRLFDGLFYLKTLKTS